ncbi:RagB/SusD family nutrient uptake outer membrane protein [Sunxiuqinia indica]|uniref:RagB/SusD family nutrient uptake outer membrane protein n=1 Tax=Sunxiuqinia indica TaxID=2692584 RepID=UPI00135B8169|nr:RagB/SusD family nutrient uptake outer membrane protein [Sunxiuqinia indica]
MKINNLLSLIIIVIFTVSCSESYFGRYPLDSLTESSFYSTQEELEYGLNDAYSSLRVAYANYLGIGDLPTDNAFNLKFNNSADNISMNESNVVASNGIVSDVWDGAYQVISRTNLILTKMEPVNLDKTLRDRFEGESKFLRALMYFNLVRIYGSVPLVLTDIKTTQEAFSIGKETVDNIYVQIIQDLTDAMNLLPDQYIENENKGRATSLAAKTLLGKVYLTLHQYQDAYDVLQEVIDAEVHHLLDNYFDVFDAANPNNSEIIFAVQYARGFSPSMGNPFQVRHFPNEQIGTAPYLKMGTGEYMLTTSLIRSFEDSDKRMIYVDSLASITHAPRYMYISKKYIDLGQTTVTDSGSDLMILRYADVLLMCAEAKAGLDKPQEALPFVAEIRTRAGLPTDNSIADSKESMNLAIEHERRIEFFSEGQRWFDLLRTGRLQTVMNAHFANGAKYPAEETGYSGTTTSTIENYELLFPIPQYEVQLNPDKLEQNPGY